MPAIVTEALTKVYRNRFPRRTVTALTELDLRVERGEIFGLLGPNGAGKTTLLKILLGIVHPTGGRASLLGRPAGDPASRRRIGFLPENHHFPPFLTAGQVLTRFGQLGGVPAIDLRRRIPALLERVRLEAWRDTRLRQFSKGMMQRLGLAQALLNDPDVVFLDEPTDGVDPIGRKEIRDLLIELRTQGKTVFLNSHLLSEIEQVCDRVAIVHKGRLIRAGTVDALTSEDRVYTLTCTLLPDEARALPGCTVTPLDPVAQNGLGRYELRVSDREQLNAALDRLRAAGVMLEALQPVRRSLEDCFIDLIERQ